MRGCWKPPDDFADYLRAATLPISCSTPDSTTSSTLSRRGQPEPSRAPPMPSSTTCRRSRQSESSTKPSQSSPQSTTSLGYKYHTCCWIEPNDVFEERHRNFRITREKHRNLSIRPIHVHVQVSQHGARVNLVGFVEVSINPKQALTRNPFGLPLP